MINKSLGQYLSLARSKLMSSSGILNVGLTILVVGGFAYYLLANPDLVQVLLEYDLRLLVALSVFPLITVAVNSYILKQAIDLLAKKIPLSDAVYTSFLSTAANYFLPLRMGAGVRALYLKTNYHFKIKDFSALLYGNYVLLFFASSLIALIGLLGIAGGGKSKIILITSMLTLLAISVSLMSSKIGIDRAIIGLFQNLPAKFINKVGDALSSLLQGWHKLVAQKRILRIILVLSVINIGGKIIMYHVLLQQAGASVNLAQTTVFSVLSNLSIFIAITPGALGVREALLLVSSETLALSNEVIIGVSLAERAVTIVSMALLALGFALLKLTRMIRNRAANSV